MKRRPRAWDAPMRNTPPTVKCSPGASFASAGLLRCSKCRSTSIFPNCGTLPLKCAHSTRRKMVDKNITLQPGDPLSPVEQTEIQKHLYDLGIFARVDTAIENPDGDTAHKYVLYDIEEANRYTMVTGFGLQLGQFGTPSKTSVSAPAGSTGISPSVSLDVNRLNFLGIGHTVTLGGVYSTLEQRGSLSYLVPHFLDDQGRSITYTVLYDHSLNVNTFSSKREEGSVQLSQRFSKSITGQ